MSQDKSFPVLVTLIVKKSCYTEQDPSCISVCSHCPWALWEDPGSAVSAFPLGICVPVLVQPREVQRAPAALSAQHVC